jgi:LysM repeat protein
LTFVPLSRFRIPIGQAVAASACVLAATLGASACGGDTLGVATTVVAVTPTNFATIPPVASTAPGTTTTLPANAVGAEQDYTVVAGDSPLAVASKFNIALTTLLAYNGWVSPAQFPYPGTIIKIPANAIAPAPVPVAPGSTTPADPAAPAAPAGPASAGCGTRPAGTYEIQKGDSFYGIYKKFCVSPSALLAANNWADNSVVLLVGKVINIPAAGS